MPIPSGLIFNRLRDILKKQAVDLPVMEDSDSCYRLQCGFHPVHKSPMPVAWVLIGKAYVSFHLMPVYAFPELLDDFSQDLRKHMQGKSCFNFKTMDEPLFLELEQLTIKGISAWRKLDFRRGG